MFRVGASGLLRQRALRMLGTSSSSSSMFAQPRCRKLSTLADEKRAESGLDGASVATSKVPTHAEVVVVGGGIIGTSTAYHLAHMGVDVVLLEQSEVTSGTTWHAAGLMVTFGSTSETSTEMRKYSRSIYQGLKEETGMDSGFRDCGFIELATNADRLEEYRRVSAFNRFCGVDVQEIPPERVQELFPLCRVDDVLSGFYVKEDGRVNPVDACMALAKGARMQGATIVTNTRVAQVLSEDGAVSGVLTEKGDVIRCKTVINCGGMWANELAGKNGVTVPNQAAEHYYLITEPMAEVDPTWPVVEDPASYGYYREEGGGIMVGLFEPKAAAWNVEGIPQDFSFGDIPPDWERMTPFLEKAMSRIPATMDAGLKTFFCGPESFTADLQPVVGEAPELRNYFVCAGLNSVGIIHGPGMGKLMAEWATRGKVDADITGFNIDRFHPYQNNPRYRRERTEESLGLVYKCHYPTYTMQSARGVKKSVIHDRVAAERAYFKETSGWEGADWFAPAGVEPVVDKLCWNRHNWFPYWQAEHKACRENVVLIDMSFMSKFLVQGRDAGTVLNWISANNVDGNIGEIVYTQWLNEDGKMEGDLTVTKLADDKFFLVVTDTQHRHAQAWLRRHIAPDQFCTVTDMTGAYSQFNIQGPRSRELMQKLTSVDMSDDAFPFRCAKEIDIGLGRLLCTRITYVGELGYELFVPTEHALHVYDEIKEHGKDLGLMHAGLKALGSLRLEKGYRDFGHDMDNTDTILEVGLGFAVDFEKPGGFLGKEAVIAQKANGIAKLPKRLVSVLCKDPEPMLFHAEILLRNGEPMGYVRVGSYGHTLGGAVGLALVEQPCTKKFINEGEWELDIAGKRYPAQVSLGPLYDAKNEKIRC